MHDRAQFQGLVSIFISDFVKSKVTKGGGMANTEWENYNSKDKTNKAYEKIYWLKFIGNK